MDQARAREILSRQAKERFGKVLELREVSVVRRASGRGWVGSLHCVTREGELRVGQMEIDDRGRVVSDFGIDALIEALQHTGAPAEGAKLPPRSAAFSEDDFALDDAPSPRPVESGDELERFLGALVEPDLRQRIERLIATGDRSALVEARELLPRLLTQPETRGGVLEQMAGIEARLGGPQLALAYLEAAAREYADAADLEGLDRVAATARAIGGESAHAGESIKALVERARARLRPLQRLAEAEVFARLGKLQLQAIEAAARVILATPGEDVLVEGAEATHAFVIKSGLFSVRLETPEGRSRVVRCCYPGDLIGESSVLGEPGASCTASVRAEGPAELWRFEGADLRALCTELPELRARIESESWIDRLDSFFSMRDNSDALDARVRDGILACMRAIRRVPAGELLIGAGAPPKTVYLIVEGVVEHRVPGAPPRRLDRDAFAGLHDALHDLAIEGKYVAVAPSNLVCFDGARLKALAADAPPQVAAALERLG